MTNKIHSTFKHGKNFKIEYFNVIHENVEVGDNCIIRSHVDLRKHTKFGDDCYIDSYVKSSGENKMGNNCTLRYNSTIARNVLIKNNVFISPNVMFINIPFVEKEKKKTIIGNNVLIGTASVINDGVVIPDETIIGAMSFVRKSIIEKGVYVGNPLRRLK